MSTMLVPVVITLLISIIWINKSTQEFSVRKYETNEILTEIATALTIDNGYRLVTFPTFI